MVMTLPAPQLRTLYLYLTEGCNCACQHCWIVAEKKRGQEAKATLNISVLRRAIEQSLPLGLSSLKWTGGEPTLHPQFSELLKIQKEYGLDGVIESNGMLIDRKLAQQFNNVGISRVSISLDGANETTHDAIRGVSGAFRKTLRGIETVVEEGFHPELILTLQRSNFRELTEYFDLARVLNAGAVKLNVLQPVLRGDTLLEQGGSLTVAEILEIKALIQASHERIPDLKVHLDLPLAFRALSGILSGEDDGVCNIFNIMGVLPRGEYALCGVGQHVPELALGDVAAVNLEEVWDTHPVLQKIREGLPERLHGVCSRCLMKSACLGSCVASNYQVSGDLLAPYWFCEQAEKMGLFPKSRQE